MLQLIKKVKENNTCTVYFIIGNHDLGYEKIKASDTWSKYAEHPEKSAWYLTIKECFDPIIIKANIIYSHAGIEKLDTADNKYQCGFSKTPFTANSITELEQAIKTLWNFIDKDNIADCVDTMTQFRLIAKYTSQPIQQITFNCNHYHQIIGHDGDALSGVGGITSVNSRISDCDFISAFALYINKDPKIAIQEIKKQQPTY